MEKRTFILAHDTARAGAIACVKDAPEGWTVIIKPPAKSRPQEEKYHAMIGDIARQWCYRDIKWDAEDLKRLCIDQFRRDTIKDPEFTNDWKSIRAIDFAPSFDGTGVVALGAQSRKFTKKLGAAFIEWLFALGAEHEVRWGQK